MLPRAPVKGSGSGCGDYLYTELLVSILGEFIKEIFVGCIIHGIVAATHRKVQGSRCKVKVGDVQSLGG
jgi:hypothetical protein